MLVFCLHKKKYIYTHIYKHMHAHTHNILCCVVILCNSAALQSDSRSVCGARLTCAAQMLSRSCIVSAFSLMTKRRIFSSFSTYCGWCRLSRSTMDRMWFCWIHSCRRNEHKRREGRQRREGGRPPGVAAGASLTAMRSAVSHSSSSGLCRWV